MFSALTALSACNDCDDETIDRAVDFLEAHQSCEVDADCVVVSTFCDELPGGMCGQLTMSRKGEESPEWQALAEELDDCSPSECTECAAALEPRCGDGSCGGP